MCLSDSHLFVSSSFHHRSRRHRLFRHFLKIFKCPARQVSANCFVKNGRVRSHLFEFRAVALTIFARPLILLCGKLVMVFTKNAVSDDLLLGVSASLWLLQQIAKTERKRASQPLFLSSPSQKRPNSNQGHFSSAQDLGGHGYTVGGS